MSWRRTELARNSKARRKGEKPLWNSLEVAKLLAGMLVPAAIAISGIVIQNGIRESDDRKSRELVIADITRLLYQQQELFSDSRAVLAKYRRKGYANPNEAIERWNGHKLRWRELDEKAIAQSWAASRVLFDGDRARFSKFYGPTRQALEEARAEYGRVFESLDESDQIADVKAHRMEERFLACGFTYVQVLGHLWKSPRASNQDLITVSRMAAGDGGQCGVDP